MPLDLIKWVQADAQVQWKASESGESTLRRFSMLAYTGGKMNLEGVSLPVVFDLETLRAAKSVPLLYGHDPDIIVGHSEDLVIDKTSGVTATGIISGVSERAKEINILASNRFPWQVSIGMMPGKVDMAKQGETVKVNGRTFDGPLYIARKGLIRELSFVSLGADSDTSAILVASFNAGVTTMSFEEWVVSLGLDMATLSEEQKTVLQLAYDALPEEPPAEPPADPPADNTNANAKNKATVNAGVDVIKMMRANASNEHTRIDRINILSAKYNNPKLKDGSLIAAKAIDEGWDVNKTELEMLKADRPKSIKQGNGSHDDKTNHFIILEAAVAQAGKLGRKKLEASFSVEVLDKAHKQYRARIGLQELLYAGAVANGYSGSSSFKSDANILQMLKANFSTLEIPNILANNVNKYLLEGYEGVDDSYEKIAAKRSVNDFKLTTGYRMSGGFTFEKIGPDGKIPHGKVSETAFTNQAETRAKMFSLTRTDIINDDLGALTSIPKMLGRGGRLALVRDFWTEFMNNSTFFAAGNNNVSSGPLAAAGISAAYNVFRKLKDPTSEFILATPRFLVVPSELEVTAEQLRTATNVIGGPTTPVPETNIWAGKFETVASPYLSDTTITGNSAIAYYLLADPNDVAVIEIAFLNGQETPTVETAEADFNMLGIQMRGVFDYGVKKQDPNGGVRSTGA